MNLIFKIYLFIFSLTAFSASFKFNHGICSRSLIAPDAEWLYLKQEKLDVLVEKLILNDELAEISKEEMDHLVNFTVDIANKDGAKIKVIGEYRTEKFNPKDYNRAFYRLAEARTNYPNGPYKLQDLEVRDFYLHHANKLDDKAYLKIATSSKPQKDIDELLRTGLGWKKTETEKLNIYKGVRNQDYVIISKENVISPSDLKIIASKLKNGKVYFDDLGEIYYASQAKNIDDLKEKWKFLGHKVIDDPEFGRILFCRDNGKCLQAKYSVDPNDYKKSFSSKEKDNIWYLLYKNLDGDIHHYE